ncbi:MAG: RnfABCDGE type electron transport complex subunit B [Gammaproteobacteria bacterium]|nr:RnfABCDGE type electron transport complex subunit B [Gammaproteobacteria bacterium]
MSASPPTPAPVVDPVDAVDALLPQTQCMRCGFAGCRPYAEALVAGSTALNLCAPGGTRLVEVLAALLERPSLPLDPQRDAAPPPRVAMVDATLCTGCARCLPACPVDAIIGARRTLHSVLAHWCTGCELCVPACPVDCIRMHDRAVGDAAIPTAADNRERFQAHQRRRHDSTTQRARLLTERKRAAHGPAAEPPA